MTGGADDSPEWVGVTTGYFWDEGPSTEFTHPSEDCFGTRTTDFHYGTDGVVHLKPQGPEGNLSESPKKQGPRQDTYRPTSRRGEYT